MTGARLASFVLDSADFRGADLRDASFAAAQLRRAKMAKANLGNAVLDKADLTGATLKEAVFTNTSLVRTNLSGAELGYVNRTLIKKQVSWITTDSATMLPKIYSGDVKPIWTYPADNTYRPRAGSPPTVKP
jgi:uncharacterized protein YjbI with pentapeptide repeats